MAHKKGQGSSRNGRTSNPKFLGVKRYGGEQVIAQAMRVLDEVAKIKEMAQQGSDQLVGQIRLGVIYTVGPYLLVATLNRCVAPCSKASIGTCR